MPRKAREIPPHQLVHVRSRFVDGRFTFDDSARRYYLLQLDRSLHDVDWTLISFALMSSHIHLGLLSGLTPLSAWIHRVHTATSGWINARRRFASPQTLGPVFGDRPSTNLVPMENTLELLTYHHNNPVKAGVVASPAESMWTSHRQYLSLPCFHSKSLDVNRGLALASLSWRQFARHLNNAADDARIVSGGPGAAVALVARHLDLPERALCGGSRARHVVFARRVVLSLASEWGYSTARTATELGISRAAATKLLNSASPQARFIGRKLARQHAGLANI